MLRLSPAQARRIAIRAQLLDARRPAGVVETVEDLVAVALDPTATIARSADLILWSRIGWPYQPADLVRAMEEDRVVFEWGGFCRPMSDLALFVPLMRAGLPYRDARDWLVANDRFRRDVLAQLAERGPLHPAEIPDTAQVSWRSSGWTHSRNSSQMLEMLLKTGEVAVAARDAKGRLFDLAERIYPPDPPLLGAEEAAALRAERRLASLGIARAKGVAQPGEPIDVGTVGRTAVVDGVDGEWQVDPASVALVEDFQPRTALLSPLDRLVFDRDRLRELFGYEYVLEMYKPAAQRRWGYFALPILHGDRLIGKLDAKADRKSGVLRVNAVHEDFAWESDAAAAVADEIESLAEWLGLTVLGLAED
ncbi:DNA glycosylase AlkZ-like family protein [Microbacterium sp. P5_E9]